MNSKSALCLIGPWYEYCFVNKISYFHVINLEIHIQFVILSGWKFEMLGSWKLTKIIITNESGIDERGYPMKG